MRTIKYKAYNKKEKRMSKPFNPFTDLVNGYEEGKTLNNQDFDLYDDIIFLEWTGLKDKNDTEIYEGDVLREDDEYSYCDGSVCDGHCETDGACGNLERKGVTGKVVHNIHYGGYILSHGNGFTFLKGEELYEYEVIGNIYQNLELLND